MNAGARASQFEVLWFLHADTLIDQNLDEVILHTMSERKMQWGRFDIRLSGRAIPLRFVERTMNWRSRLTGIATGDQGIFMNREVFVRLGGFADIPLMEDIDISHRLKRMVGRPVCLDQKLLTSSRRWETQGVWRTIFMMWGLRLGYALGMNPVDLAWYYR